MRTPLGEVHNADEVCAAAETVLRDTLPWVLEDLGLERIEEFRQVPTEQALDDGLLPAIAITSPGLSGEPRRTQRGWETTWSLVVGCYVRGYSYDETARLNRLYASLIRTVLLQDQTLGGLAQNVDWVGEEYALKPAAEEARTLAGSACAFTVKVLAVATPRAAPPRQPGPGPEVTSTSVTVTASQE